jgi:4a-hydroxytetrahydrobiopterin dehydratase
MDGKPGKLNEEAVEKALAGLPAWQMDDGKLARDWVFKDFAEAMTFVNSVAEIAEAANHHPDIDIRYNQVRLALVSHDLGGITKRDVALAEKIDSKFKS